MKVGFDDSAYERYRRRLRIHRIHLVGYVVSATLILAGMLKRNEGQALTIQSASIQSGRF